MPSEPSTITGDRRVAVQNHGVSVTRIILVVMLVVSAATGHVTTTAQAVSCTDFDAFEWAQSVYEADPVRYAALDPDGDGIACPELGPGAAPALWTTSVPAGAEPARLSRVVDGDTADFVLSDGTTDRVRFLLIDTPETVDPSRPVGCFGQEASDFTTWLLSLGETPGAAIYLERDVSERDQYDRLLRYVWLDLGGEVYLVNEALARSGYASLSTFPPDVKYVEQIQAAQAFAERHQRGLWGACPSFDAPLPVQPSDTQPARTSSQAPVAPAGTDCDPSYPTLCLPSSPDLDCGDIPDRRFPVLPADPHAVDGDHDGVGCEGG